MKDRVVNNSTQRIICKYGKYSDGSPHRGVDIGYDKYDETNNLIYANCKGTVYETQDGLERNIHATGKATWGNFVLIKHPNGLFTRYAHLQKETLRVKKGDVVDENTILGVMGDSGITYGTYARHCHFEVATGYSSNTRIDPTPYLSKAVYEEPTPQPTPTSTEDFKVGDRVLVIGRATEASDGTGKQTAEYTGNPNDASDIRYITLIEEYALRPYHISAGQTFGEHNKGWVSKDQIKKI